MLKPDALIEIRLLTPDQGGRQTPIVGEYFGCPLYVKGRAFDCRLFLEGKSIEFGRSCLIRVKFLIFEDAKPFLKIDGQISLWEGKTIATGRIVEIYN
ncbi:hypothetical protein J2Y55_003209 [Bosea sp. BE125]|uniref:hypothetical protein n=1 Tax=Bosea sp. BE125 TaxID=2817909 RepID=UPI0028567F1A|nr:hypothetical protein [Bosea sp. BE125]MDR6872193.1 hypothetical protein [Bosea sp. BE125]